MEFKFFAEYSSSVSEYEESEDGAEGEAATDEPTTTLEESWSHTNKADSEGQATEPPSMMLNKQELLRQCQLKQHIDKLEEEVKRKEESVNRIRLVLRFCLPGMDGGAVWCIADDSHFAVRNSSLSCWERRCIWRRP